MTENGTITERERKVPDFIDLILQNPGGSILMKIVTLNKEKLPAFENMDPLDVSRQKQFKANFMLGATREGEEEDVPAGLLLGNMEKKNLTLRWLFVAPEARRRSYAERLLSEAFLAARDQGLEELTVTFPDVYGYKTICRNDRAFFLSHGFTETADGKMTAKVADYDALTEYKEIPYEDATDMLDRLLALELHEEEEEKKEADLDAQFADIHKPWDTRSTGLLGFSRLPVLQKFIKTILSSKKPLTVGCIGDLTFTQFKEGIELCEKKEHTGFLKSLFETPVDYFDMDVSSYTMSEGGVTGLCLVHFNKSDEDLVVELLYSADDDKAAGLAELMRYSLAAANEKYDPDTKILLPNDEKLHQPLIKKLFGE